MNATVAGFARSTKPLTAAATPNTESTTPDASQTKELAHDPRGKRQPSASVCRLNSGRPNRMAGRAQVYDEARGSRSTCHRRSHRQSVVGLSPLSVSNNRRYRTQDFRSTFAWQLGFSGLFAGEVAQDLRRPSGRVHRSDQPELRRSTTQTAADGEYLSLHRVGAVVGGPVVVHLNVVYPHSTCRWCRTGRLCHVSAFPTEATPLGRRKSVTSRVYALSRVYTLVH